MNVVFTKLLGGSVSPDGETVFVGLQGQDGPTFDLEFSPDVLEDLAHTLLALRAHADQRQQQGVPPDVARGDKANVRALTVTEIGIDDPDDPKRCVLRISVNSGGEYRFAISRSEIERVGSLFLRTQP